MTRLEMYADDAVVGNRPGGARAGEVTSVSSTPAPDAPTITAPTASQVLDDSTPDIVVSEPEGATLWKFRVGNSDFSSIVASVDDHNSSTWTVSPALTYADTLYVQAAAGNEAGYSDWSEAVAFKQSYRLKVIHYAPTEAWRMNETSGTAITALLDANKNGTWNGVTLNARTFLDGGAAPGFDGINDFGSVLTAALQSAWSGTQGSMLIWAYDTEDATTFRYASHFAESDGAQYVSVYKSGGSHIAVVHKTVERTQGIARAANAWRCFGASWNVTGNIVRLYLNGTAVTPSGTAILNSATLNAAYFGRRIDGRYWQGSLAWGLYWNTLQSDAVMLALSSVPT